MTSEHSLACWNELQPLRWVRFKAGTLACEPMKVGILAWTDRRALFYGARRGASNSRAAKVLSQRGSSQSNLVFKASVISDHVDKVVKSMGHVVDGFCSRTSLRRLMCTGFAEE